MKILDIILPDNPLEEIKRVSSKENLETFDFDIDKMLSNPPNKYDEDIPKAFHKKSTYWFSYPDKITASIIYPPDGGMDWHTNSDLAGKRMYVSWSETGDSGMGWIENGKTKLDYDHVGWNIRIFSVPQWHCVFSKCWRCSVGIKI